MSAIKSFPVFVETIEVHVSSAMSNGASSVIVTLVPPGGGPPPHTHTREDEIFTALEGEFELLIDGAWQPISVGVPVHGQRGKTHTFRNAGKSNGRLHVVSVPGGLDEFLEKLSPLTQGAPDMAKIMELGKSYGIMLQPPGGPSAA